MYAAAGLVGLLYLFLMFLSRKEVVDTNTKVLLRPFYQIAIYLYKQACIHKLPIFSSGRVSEDLARLNPGKAGQGVCTDYYIHKLARSFVIVLIGTFLGLVISIQAQNKRMLKDAGVVERRSYREGGKEIEVECPLPEGTQNFRIWVEARTLSKEQTTQLYNSFSQNLEELVLGKNISLEEVSEDLCLEEAYEGYPFQVTWKSDTPELLRSDGTIILPVENLQEVRLTATVSYGKREWEKVLRVQVAPKPLLPWEYTHREMESLLYVSEEESREEKNWQLPQSFHGQTLVWKEKIRDKGLLFPVGAVVAAAIIYKMSDRDLHELLEKKRKKMKQEYPDIVHTLSLYLGAGMSIRGAFLRMAADYERGRKNGKRASPVREELLFMCRELQAGVSEGASYEHFGKRTGLQEYIRLSALLTQNLKKGNSTLLQRLHEEAEKASVERLQYGKRLGEEAVTKLLLPMVLMLLVVMVMIMIPAFSAMGT